MREQSGLTMDEQHTVRFGNYDLIRPIDNGGMGEVYLAHQRSAFGRPVAIKIIRSDLVHDLTARARFLREAEVSAHLKHEHILPLFEFGEDQGRLFLVTPYIEGGTLARRLQSGPLSLHEVRQLFVPLVQAVAYIHRRGVIHRDLKPTNILLDEQDGQIYVRLIDFGIATVQGGEASPPLTTAGNEVGTIAYMAPERLNGVAAPSNDIFSLGVILHQMLTGNLPMGEQFDDMPKPLEYVVFRCMAMRPEERFATADEVLKNFDYAYRLVTMPVHITQSRPLDDPSMSHDSAQLAFDDASQSMVSLHQSAHLPVIPGLPSALPLPADAPAALSFGQADYNAPTTAFNTASLPPHPITPLPALSAVSPAQPRKRRGKKSLLPFISALMVVLLLAIAFLAYYGYQTITTTAVTVNFAPKAQAISKLFTITATPAAQSVDVTNALIPERQFTSNKTGTQSARTTGRICTFGGIFGCQPSVSQFDVDNLVYQMRSGLQAQLSQALQSEITGAGGTNVAGATFTDVTITSDPQVNQPGNTVSVTLVEQGSVVYYVNADAQNLARQLLARQVAQINQQSQANNVLIDSTVAISKTAITAIDPTSGRVTIAISAGGDILYQFPSSFANSLKGRLKGMTIQDARAFLALQPGIDPATIGIHFTTGSSNSLPGDIQRITIVPINASTSSYPPIQLQPLPAALTPPPITPNTNDNPPNNNNNDNNNNNNNNNNNGN
jgi:serine/threonine protein kinase